MIFSFGSNSNGQLGINSHEDKSSPTSSIDSIANVIQVSGGSNHSLVLDSDGTVFGCGDNSLDQLGLPEKNVCRFVSLNKKGKSVYCGWDCSFVVDKYGNAWAIGSNSYGVCGVGSDENRIQQWTKVPLDSVSKISTGPRHTLFLTDAQILWGAGATKQGMLGIQSKLIESSPVRIVDNVVDCAAGQFHSVILKSDHQVFVFGKNKFGQLGVQCKLDCSFVPIQIQLPPQFEPKSVGSGWSTCRVLSTDGRLILWGRGDSGQLGTKIDGRFSSEILELKHLICSHEFGSEHSLAINTNGQLISWGWNEHGNCGNNSLDSVFVPIVIANSVNLIGAGGGHSLYVCNKE